MKIERATAAMFDDIFPVLQEFGSTGLRKEDWRRLVDYRFSDEDYRGWVSIERDEVTGFLGAIFSKRGAQRFCNLTSWVVKKEHRKANLALLEPLCEMADHTLLNLSPSPFTLQVFRRLGFSELEDRLLILPPSLVQRAPRGLRIVDIRDEIVRMLEPRDLRIFLDHLSYNCHHVVVSDAHGYCYVVASKTKLRRFSVSFIHHISDRERFCRARGAIQRALMRVHATPLAVVDARLLAGQKIRGALSRRLPQPRLYRPAKGSGVPPEAIDSLYTEFVVLNPSRWTFNY